VLCPSSPSLNLTEAFTIEAWINPIGWGENSAFGFGRIIDKQRFLFLLTDSNPVLNDYSICLWLFHEDGSNSRSVAPDNSISLNSWQHVAVTYDGISEVKIYVYGQEQSLTQTVPPAGNILDNSANDFIIGNSDEAKLYIYNIKGQQVKQFSNLRNQTSVIWDGKDENNQPVSSGIYFYRLKTNNEEIHKRMILLK